MIINLFVELITKLTKMLVNVKCKEFLLHMKNHVIDNLRLNGLFKRNQNQKNILNIGLILKEMIDGIGVNSKELGRVKDKVI